jgi:cytochrome c oxidase cbb3-type subunit 2
MNNLPALFLGVFATLAFSWVGIVLATQIQVGHLKQTTEIVDENGKPVEGDTLYPRRMTGVAEQGKRVYEAMGCLHCHSQQVRRKGFGTDYERTWGDRQSVARDYINQKRVMLGTSRTGPDLMTVGSRTPSAEWHHQHLYHPQSTSPGSIMPPYPFLYRKQPIDPIKGPSPKALALSGRFAPEEGYEIVPTERAEALVAYLLSLKMDYTFPEASRVLQSELNATPANAGTTESPE